MRSTPWVFPVLALLVTPSLKAATYDQIVEADQPVYFLASAHGASYAHGGTVATAPLPNGDAAARFDGETQFLEAPASAKLSIATTGALTVEAWLRPDKLQFPRTEGEGYVYWLGKGQAGEQEYAGRMYALVNSAGRPSRISGYAFNLGGGLGSGSYFQDHVEKGRWMQVAITFNTVPSATYPTGYVRIYRDGQLRDTTALAQFNVHPALGSAPLRIGTRDMNSYFDGAIGKVAVYGYELSSARLLAHVRAMLGE